MKYYAEVKKIFDGHSLIFILMKNKGNKIISKLLIFTRKKDLTYIGKYLQKNDFVKFKAEKINFNNQNEIYAKGIKIIFDSPWLMNNAAPPIGAF